MYRQQLKELFIFSTKQVNLQTIPPKYKVVTQDYITKRTDSEHLRVKIKSIFFSVK